MAVDPALATFLALEDEAAADYADARARVLGLVLPPETRAGVIENLTLLRRQTALFTTALDGAPDAPSQTPGPFEP